MCISLIALHTTYIYKAENMCHFYVAMILGMPLWILLHNKWYTSRRVYMYRTCSCIQHTSQSQVSWREYPPREGVLPCYNNPRDGCSYRNYTKQRHFVPSLCYSGTHQLTTTLHVLLPMGVKHTVSVLCSGPNWKATEIT